MRLRQILLAVTLGVAGTILPLEPAAAAPANDALASATLLTQVPVRRTQSTAGATVQSGEPRQSCATAQRTVWFEIRLAQATPVAVSTYGSSYDTTLAVYTATTPAFSKLTAIQCSNDMGTGKTSMVGWVADPGARYFVQVGGNGSATSGTLRLRVTYGTRIDRPDTAVAVFSTAATAAIAADDGGVDLGARVRESFCYSLFCFTLLEVQADARVSPTVPPQDGIEDCVRVIAVFVFIVEQCGPV